MLFSLTKVSWRSCVFIPSFLVVLSQLSGSSLLWAQSGPGLVAGYGFSEGSGTTTADASANGITGTLRGATWTTSGKFGNALSFNGTSGYVDLGNPAALKITGSMTWSAWIFATTNPADDGQIVSKSGNSGSTGWQFKTTPDTGQHTFGVGVASSATAITQRYSNTVRALNTWYHVAGVYNASAGTLDIYVNGTLDNGVLIGTVPTAQFDPAVNVNIGRRSSGGFFFAGTIDEVRIYNRALSQAEIQTDMNTPVSGGGAADTQPPTAPSGLTATAAGSAQINLSWTASTDNVGVTGYRVERCQGAACTTFAQIATPTGTTFSDTGLTASTSYSYRVRATDGAGNLSGYSNTSSATTTAATDTQPPTAPSALTATAASATQINLSWTASTDNVGVAGYRVERCQGAGCSTFAQIATPTGTTFSDTGLTASTSYSYRVRAADAAGNLSGYSNTSSATTPAATDTQPPTAPSGLAATAAGANQVNLSWTASTDNVGVTGYRVERCQGAGCTTFSQVSAPTGTTYNDLGLTSGTSYSYRVRATDAAGNLGSYSNVATATTAAASAGPIAAYSFNEGTGTTAADASGSGITGTLVGATWTASGKYGNALSFNGTSSYVNLGNPAALKITGSMTWSAWIFATANPADDGQIVSKSGASGSSGWQFKTTPDTGQHTFGVGVASSATSVTQRYSNTVRALNTWYYVAGVYNATAGTLDIYVNGALDNGALVGTVPATQFDPAVNVNIGRRSSGGFFFAGTIDEVRIYNRALTQTEIQSDMNSPIGGGTADTQPPTAPGGLSATAAGPNQINLSWTASTDNVGVAGYRVERCQGVGCSTFAQIATPTGTTYNDTGLAANTSYSYRVRAADAAGNLSPYSNSASATTAAATDTQPPTAPSGLAATAAGATQINLSWTAATDNVGVTGYRVERCQGAGCTTFAQISAPAGTTFSDTGLTAGTSYSYRVRATDAAGNLGPYSNVASATTAAGGAGPVAAYAFSEGSGTTTADASGNGITGTLQGATWTASGKYGNALSFNGTSSYVDLGNPTQLKITGSATWSAWIFATANPADDGQIVAKSGNNGSTGWQLKTTPDTGQHTFGVGVASSGTSITQRYSNTVRALNTWYHVAGVYNATARTLDIYVNGVLDNGVLVGTVPASQFDPAVNVNIGRRTGGFFFAGTIDEVRIYNRALTQAEVQTDMNTPLAGGTADTQPPTAPSGLAATAASGTQINLSWTASTDNVAVTGYRVERCQGAGCTTFAQIATASGTTFSDTGLTTGTSYSYRVRATDGAGNLSGYSNVASATTTTTTDTQAPTPPSNLTATPAGGNQLLVTWTASTDNVGVTGYRIERCQGAGCTDFARIALPSGTSYLDTGLAVNTNYSYHAQAADAAGNLSPYSNVGSATTQGTVAGLVAAYGFGEGSGTTTADASGNGITGTLRGATWTTAGKYGNALSFDGVASYVDLGNPTPLKITGSMTWSAWINSSGNPADDGQIISKAGGTGQNGWQFKTTPDTGPRTFGVAVSSNGTAITHRFSSTVPALNTWYHVAGVYNAGAGTLDIYVNGVLDNGVLGGTIPAAQFDPAVNVNIGRRTGGFYFKGTIDEVRVYNRALTLSEIQNDMNTPIATGGGTLPAVGLNPTSIDFGSQQVGIASAGRAITVTNTGGGTLSISSVAITGTNIADFSQSNACGSPIPANGTCTITVAFMPTVTGIRSAAVTISDNAAGNPHTVSLSGTGTSTGLSISPRNATLTFTRTQQFTASTNVTWSVDGIAGGSPSVGTVSTSGLYTPPNSVGTHTVTATATGSQSVSATVYITNHPGVFTHHNDNLRTGQNQAETVLTPSNVTSAQFGKLFSYPVDGLVLASPLYVANVSIPGQGFHNVVYVATEHNSVYAFDADNRSSTPLWQVSFINPAAGVTTVPPADTGECCDIPVEIGITGTPVIDQSTGTLYVVAKTKETTGSTTNYVQKLHALDITTGAERFGGPVVIQASVPGTGSGSSGGSLPFNPKTANQRPALLLSNGVVYIAFSGHGDQPPYHGWVLGYNAANLQRVMTFCATPNGSGAGIWQGGAGLATDSTGNIYGITANGTFDVNTGGKDYGDTFFALTPAGAVTDYFTPHDQRAMDTGNLDLGSGGLLLIPDQTGAHPHLMTGAGKSQELYLIDRDNMGHYNPNDDSQIVQTLVNIFPNGTPEPGNDSSPVYFNGTVYYGPINDAIKAFRMTNGLLSTAPTNQTARIYAYPGGAISASANGTSNGILWAIERPSATAAGILHAYNASNLATELYNSSQAGTRDTLDIASKFVVPVIVNGQVFVVSNSRLTVYGLLQ